MPTAWDRDDPLNYDPREEYEQYYAPRIPYQRFIIERNPYGSARHGDRWMWAPVEEDGTPYSFEDTPEACKEAIDDELADQAFLKNEEERGACDALEGRPAETFDWLTRQKAVDAYMRGYERNGR